MTAVGSHRRALLGGGLASYGAVFVAFLLFERPGLGIGHFLYVSILLVALATNAFWGAAAGVLATGVYVAAVLVTPSVPAAEAITTATAIRLVTYVAVGAVVGLFVQTNRRLVEQLREQAQRDFLTGLFNARAFDEALAARCRAGSEFLLVLADMDDLKRVNDAHGHDEGNRAIRHVAGVLRRAVRDDDELARIGGDEFALLTAAPAGEAGELAARLRQVLRREGQPVSFGWSSAPVDGTDPVALFRKADDRLYAAKLLHRNRQSTLRVARQEPLAG